MNASIGQFVSSRTPELEPALPDGAYLLEARANGKRARELVLVGRTLAVIKATINGVAGTKRNDVAFGLTLGYKVNNNMNLTVGYKSTVNDSAPGDMRMDSFMVTLVFGWHPLIEGSRRLAGDK